MPTFIPLLESRILIWKRKHFEKQAANMSIKASQQPAPAPGGCLVTYTLGLNLMGYWNSTGLRVQPTRLSH